MKTFCFAAVLLLVLISLASCVDQNAERKTNIQGKKIEQQNKENRNLPRELEAYNEATQVVIQALQEPATAQFPGTREKLEHIESLGSSRFHIDSWVDSQDTYGAITRRSFSFTFRMDSSGIVKEVFVLEEVGHIPKEK